jgi:Ca2+-transporting ATPase
MITGDHPETAASVARSVGLLERGAGILTGSEIARLDDGALAARVVDTRVFARVAPDQKLRIVEAFQSRGQLVAMTGDGVNDAPALKRADIGVAMGKRGTDVARGASDLVLLDDNFATIVAAVRAGRQIYDNIRKFVRFVLTGNVGELVTLMLAPLLGLPMPLLPIHILWINLVTDGLPGIALTVEPAESDVMRRPPRPPNENIFARGLGAHVAWIGVLIGAVTLFGAAWSYREGSTHWRTVAFTILAVSQLGHSMGVRSERESIARIGWLSNRPLLLVVVASIAIQIGVLYSPLARALLKLDPLSPLELLASLVLASLAFVGAEIEKWLLRRRG